MELTPKSECEPGRRIVCAVLVESASGSRFHEEFKFELINSFGSCLLKKRTGNKSRVCHWILFFLWKKLPQKIPLGLGPRCVSNLSSWHCQTCALTSWANGPLMLSVAQPWYLCCVKGEVSENLLLGFVIFLKLFRFLATSPIRPIKTNPPQKSKMITLYLDFSYCRDSVAGSDTCFHTCGAPYLTTLKTITTWVSQQVLDRNLAKN